ncbi:MAG: hypothetical protein CL912_11485 [Deltaproteobacteria bacterium]|nr:hypothetical protein [Deltaproteobacteria bacterium]
MIPAWNGLIDQKGLERFWSGEEPLGWVISPEATLVAAGVSFGRRSSGGFKDWSMAKADWSVIGRSGLVRLGEG